MSSQGPNLPGTAADGGGPGAVWSNPNNIFTCSDAIYATAALGGLGASNYLQATNFGFTIPGGATINGIVVEIQKKAGLATNIYDLHVYIIKGGTSGGTDHAAAGWWPTSEAFTTYGSSSDLWGLTWTSTDINATNFGVEISCACISADTASIDCIRITVYYTTGTTYDNSISLNGTSGFADTLGLNINPVLTLNGTSSFGDNLNVNFVGSLTLNGTSSFADNSNVNFVANLSLIGTSSFGGSGGLNFNSSLILIGTSLFGGNSGTDYLANLSLIGTSLFNEDAPAPPRTYANIDCVKLTLYYTGGTPAHGTPPSGGPVSPSPIIGGPAGITPDGWDYRRLQRNDGLIYDEFQQFVTFTGSTQNIDLTIPFPHQLDRIGLAYDDGTARTLQINLYHYIKSYLVNYGVLKIYSAGTNQSDELIDIKRRFLWPTKMTFAFSSYTAGKTVNITVGLIEMTVKENKMK